MKVNGDDNGEIRTQRSALVQSTDSIHMGEGFINSFLQEQVGTLWKTETQTGDHEGAERSEGRLKTDT